MPDQPPGQPADVPGLEADARVSTEPMRFVDGFSARTVIGALFVAVVMMPGTIYLGLVAGKTLGPAAEWVTIILFAEVARRSFTSLKKQEVYILFHVAAGLSASALVMYDYQLAGGPFTGLVWNQYIVQSPQTEAVAKDIPDWVAPQRESPAIRNRNLFHRDWLKAIALVLIGQVLGRMNWFGMGYIVFRLTSDMERLPFPLAPIAAEGATALAEATQKEQSWRWKVFSTGSAIGIVFGAVYIILPVLTGLIMTQPLMLLPIPFVDLTASTEAVLPTALIGISFDLGILIVGMVLPFPMVIGMFFGVLATSVFGNPLMYKLSGGAIFPHWNPGTRLLPSQMTLFLDFWLSAGIGLASAVAIVGIARIVTLFARRRKESEFASEQVLEDNTPRRPSRNRGDVPMWLAGVLFLTSTLGYIYLCHVLVPGFRWWIIALFGLLYTPLISYVSARMIGVTGAGISIPFLREGAFLLSGYQHVDIWFAPLPMFDHGQTAMGFRALELTGTRITSLIKAELIMIPIGLVASFLFWWFFWHLSQIPSGDYPYTARIWPFAARTQFLYWTATSEGNPLLLEALKPTLMIGGAVIGLVLYAGCSVCRSRSSTVWLAARAR